MSRTLNIKQIEKGLEAIRNFGHLSETFEVLGIPVTLRTLRRGELEAANLHCRPEFEEAQRAEDAFMLTTWVQRVKLESLSYAVMGVGDIDFTGIEYVATGEIDEESGKEIRVQKHVFVRGLLNEWEDSTTEVLYKKFQELTNRASDKAGEGVVFDDPASIMVRIQELEAEIQELKQRVEAKGNNVEEENSGSDLDLDAIRASIYSPIQDPPEEAPRKSDDGYLYADAGAEGAGKNKGGEQQHYHSQGDNAPLNESEAAGPYYVDGDNRPLEGEALAIAREQDRLYRQREESGGGHYHPPHHPPTNQAPALLAAKRRQPLNQIDAQAVVTAPEGQGAENYEGAERLGRNNPAPGEIGVLPAYARDSGVEYLDGGSGGNTGGQGKARLNPDVHVQGNPNYQPRQK